MKVEIGLSVVDAPDGRPALCLQLPDGYVLLTAPDQVRALAVTLEAGADRLADVIEARR